jgi:hypothetical protein
MFLDAGRTSAKQSRDAAQGYIVSGKSPTASDGLNPTASIPGRPVFFIPHPIALVSPPCLAECPLVLVAPGRVAKAPPAVPAPLVVAPVLLEVALPLVVASAADPHPEGVDQLLLLLPPVVQSPRQVS